MRRSHHGADDGLRAHFFDPNRKGHVPKLPAVGGAGVATGRWTWRHEAPAVVGRFIFFATWPFLAIRRIRVLGTRRRTDEAGLTPDPHSKNGKSPKILSPKIFNGDSKHAQKTRDKKKSGQFFWAIFKLLVNTSSIAPKVGL